MTGIDAKFMAAALALSMRGKGRTGGSPSVGCIIVKDGRIIGRGWTQPGGRPHAEAMALAQVGAQARADSVGASVYVTLEPCAHESDRGPACADTLIAARVARVIIAVQDPDPRTAGAGAQALQHAGIVTETGLLSAQARRAMAGFFMRQTEARPFVTLKLATSLDGKMAMADGSSRWITGNAARRHCHLERAQNEAILVGAGTYRIDTPALNVRLAGLENRSPMPIILSSSAARDGWQTPDGWQTIAQPQDISALDCNHLLVEGGARTAASFLQAGLVDRLLLYRAPILIGDGTACLGDIGLQDLSDAHNQWTLADARMLGKDRLEIYERIQ